MNEKSLFMVGIASEFVKEARYLKDGTIKKVTDASLIISTLPAIDQAEAVFKVSVDFQIPRDHLVAYELKV